MAATLWGSVASDAPPLRFAAAAGLLALAQDSVLRVWRLASAAAAPALLLATPSGVSALALGARGDDDRKLTLAAASADQLVGWLLACEGAEEVAVAATWSLSLASFGTPPEAIRAAHFDGAGRRLALCAGTEVWVVDVDSCTPLLRLQGHAAPTSLCCSRGSQLLTVADDRVFHLWRLPPLEAPGAAEAQLLLQEALPPSGAPVTSAALRPDGSQLVVGDAEGRLLVYELTPAGPRVLCRCTHRIELARALPRAPSEGEAEARPQLPATQSSLPAWQQQQRPAAAASGGGMADASAAVLAVHYAPLPPLAAAAALRGGAGDGDGGGEWGVVVATPAATLLLREGVWQPHAVREGGPRAAEPAVAAVLLGEAAVSALAWAGAARGEAWLARASAFQPWLRLWQLRVDRVEAAADAPPPEGDDAGGRQVRSVLPPRAPAARSPLAVALAALAAPAAPSAVRARPAAAAKPSPGRRADQPVTFHRKIASSGYGAAPVMKLHAGGPCQAAAAAAAAAARRAPGRGSAAATRAYSPSQGPIRCLQHDNSAAAPPLGGALLGARYAPDASRLAVGGAEGAVTLLRLPTRRHPAPPPTLSAHDAAIASLHWSHSGRLLLSASADGSARLWDVGADRPPAAPLLALRHLRHSPAALHASDGGTAANPLLGGPVRQAGFYYLDRLLLLACANALHLYSYALGRADDDAHRAAELRHSHRLHHRWALPHAQHATCFAAANSFLSPLAIVAGSDRSVTAVDLGAGREVCAWRGMHERAVHAVCLYEGSAHTAAPDAARDLFLTSAADGSARLWDLRTAACARTFSAHVNRVHAVGAALSPCLRYVATGSEDKQAYVYDLRSARLVATLGGHADAVTDVAFSPLHPQLATASLDGRVRFFADAAAAS